MEVSDQQSYMSGKKAGVTDVVFHTFGLLAGESEHRTIKIGLAVTCFFRTQLISSQIKKEMNLFHNIVCRSEVPPSQRFNVLFVFCSGDTPHYEMVPGKHYHKVEYDRAVYSHIDEVIYLDLRTTEFARRVFWTRWT